MPIIRVEMLPGRTVAQKRALVESLTEGFLQSCGGRKEAIQVIITETEADNWGIGAKLLADKHEPDTSE